MKEILKLIESVDPKDGVKLNEINSRVWCFLKSAEYCGATVHKMGWRYKGADQYEKTILNMDTPNYVGSRDALKAIRPNDRIWIFQVHFDCSENVGASAVADHTRHPTIRTKVLPTEELAELSAIIQAIAHERGEK